MTYPARPRSAITARKAASRAAPAVPSAVETKDWNSARKGEACAGAWEDMKLA